MHNASFLFLFIFRYSNDIPQIVIRGFIGTVEEALKYIDLGYYITLNGYLCKVSVKETTHRKLNLINFNLNLG